MGLILTVAFAVPLVVVGMAAGRQPGMLVFLGALNGFGLEKRLDRGPLALVVAATLVLMLFAASFNGDAAWIVAGLVALSAPPAAWVNQWHGDAVVLAPVWVRIAGTLVWEPSPAQMVLWVISGLGYGFLVAIALKLRAGVPGFHPVDAWGHALILGAMCGAATWSAIELDLSNGYWLVITLVVVLRPTPDYTLRRTRERILGTLGGGLIALGAATLLPEDWLLPSPCCACGCCSRTPPPATTPCMWSS